MNKARGWGMSLEGHYKSRDMCETTASWVSHAAPNEMVCLPVVGESLKER